jgi:hypothetical protein
MFCNVYFILFYSYFMTQHITLESNKKNYKYLKINIIKLFLIWNFILLKKILIKNLNVKMKVNSEVIWVKAKWREEKAYNNILLNNLKGMLVYLKLSKQGKI